VSFLLPIFVLIIERKGKSDIDDDEDGILESFCTLKHDAHNLLKP
jgi:hypothetical protein